MLFLSHVFEINLAHQSHSLTESVPPWNTKDHPRCGRAEGVPEVSWKPSLQGSRVHSGPGSGALASSRDPSGSSVSSHVRGVEQAPHPRICCVGGKLGIPALSDRVLRVGTGHVPQAVGPWTFRNSLFQH